MKRCLYKESSPNLIFFPVVVGAVGLWETGPRRRWGWGVLADRFSKELRKTPGVFQGVVGACWKPVPEERSDLLGWVFHMRP